MYKRQVLGLPQIEAPLIDILLHHGVDQVGDIPVHVDILPDTGGADVLQLDVYKRQLLVVCDEISDPHNLGAILRTAECAGAHGVIIPKRRSAGLTAIVAKTSAGAVSYMPVARVANIPSLLKDLKKQGVWVFGTAADGNTTLYNACLLYTSPRRRRRSRRWPLPRG